MLKVSTKSTYAIRAMVDLGRTTQEGPRRLADIAERQNIPLPFLEQIFSKLRKAGLIESIRGPQGGYRLKKTTQEICLQDIIEALEGPLEPVLCSHPEKKSDQCRDVEGCMSRLVCHEIDGALAGVLHRHTLASLCGEAERLSGISVANTVRSVA